MALSAFYKRDQCILSLSLFLLLSLFHFWYVFLGVVKWRSRNTWNSFFLFCKDNEGDREEGGLWSFNFITPLYTVTKFSKISWMEIVAVNIAETVQFLPKVMKWQLNNQTDYIQKAKPVETRSGKHLAMVQGQNDRVSIII